MEWFTDQEFDRQYAPLTEALRKLEVRDLILLAHCMNTDGDCLPDPIFNPDGKKELINNIFDRIRLMRSESVQLERMRKALRVLDSRGCHDG